MTLQGDEALISRLRESFSPHGSRAFDVAMMETVYGRPFCVETAGMFDLDSELTLHTPSGSKTTFEFSAGFDIRGLCRAIAARIL